MEDQPTPPRFATDRILVVDDDPDALAEVRDQLGSSVEVRAVATPEEALDAIRSERYAAVVADMTAPRMSGLELLVQVMRVSPATARIMLTADTRQETAVRALNEASVHHFLARPCPTDRLVAALREAVAHYRHARSDLAALQETLGGCIRVLTEILSLVDSESFSRASRLRSSAREVARTLDLARPWEIEMGVMLSQLGRITLPTELNEKIIEGGELTGDEAEVLLSVPRIGADLIANIPRMDGVATIIRQQRLDYAGDHEGAPVVGARIVRALWDMAEYQEAGFTGKYALREMKEQGVYDPKILRSVRQNLDVQTFAPGESHTSTAAIFFKSLRVGYVLAKPVETRAGQIVVREGHAVNSVMFERLKNYKKLSGLKEPIEIYRDDVKGMPMTVEAAFAAGILDEGERHAS